MPVTVNHSLTATTPDNPSFEIRPSHWNSAHVGTLAAVGSEISGAFANGNGVSFGLSAGSISASHNALTSQSNQAFSAQGGSSAFQTLSFSNGGGVSFTNSNGQVAASVVTTWAGSNHSHGDPTLALTNLTGTTASNSAGFTLSLSAAAGGGGADGGVGVSAGANSVSAGTVVFSNSNGVSFGLNGSTVTASHNGLTTAAASNHSHGNPTLNLTNLSGTTASNSAGLTLSLSANPTQTNQSIGIYASSNTTGQSSSSTVDARSLSFRGVGALSVGMSGGEVVLSVAAGAQSNQSVGVYGVGNTTVNSSGTVDARTVSIRGYGVLSVGTSNGSVLLSTPDPVDFTYLSVGNSNLGNTAGDTGVFSQRMVLVGSNNITLSGSSNGGSATLSIIGGGGAGPAAVYDGANSISTGTILFTNANGVTFTFNGQTLSASVNTSYAASNHSHGNPTLALTNITGTTASASNGLTLSLSAAANQTGISGVVASDATYSSGSVYFSNQNGVTVGSSADGASQYVRLSVATSYAASNHSHGNPTLALTNLSGTTASASNGLTLSLSALAALTSQSNQQITAANGGFTFQTLSFSNVNGISFGTSAGSAITASHNAITTARASTDAIGLNTAQTNVTWTVNSSGLSVNAAGYAGTATAITGGAAITLNSVGMSFNGASLAGTSSGFTGANISASITHNTAGFAMSASVAAPGAANESNNFNLLGANTAGNTTASGTTLGLSGINVTLSGTNNSVIIISAPATSSLVGASGLSVSTNGSTISVYPPPLSEWDNFGGITAAGTAQGNSLVSVQNLRVDWPLAFSNVAVPVSINVTSAANASTAYIDLSISGVMYTRNASTLSSLFSFSNSMTQTWSSNATGTVTGVPFLTATFAGTTLTPGQYYLALHISTTNTATGGANTTALANTISVIHHQVIGSAANLVKNWGAQTNASLGVYSGNGILSTGATRASIAFSDYVMTGTRGVLAHYAVGLRNQTLH